MSASISIIIPTFNMGHFLPAAIKSVIDNAFQDIELIIIDDGSTDNTKQVVEEFKKQANISISYHHVAHRGKAGCLNEIFSSIKLQGDYIIFMDADDMLPSSSLQKRMQAIKETSADLVIGEFAVTNLQGDILDTRMLDQRVTKKELAQHYFFSPKNLVHLNACIISKDLLLRTGRFDETLLRSQEVDYLLGLLEKSKHFEILPFVVYHYRKYYRPLKNRIKIRFKTMYYRFKTINKHLWGIQKAKAIILHTIFDFTKLFYEVFINYRR